MDYRKPKSNRSLSRKRNWGKFGVIIAIIALIIQIPNSVIAALEYFAPRQPQKKEQSLQDINKYSSAIFTEWDHPNPVNDLEENDGLLSLKQVAYRQRTRGMRGMDPQGYIQVPVSMPENVFACSKFYAHTQAIDYSFRVNNKFQIIQGDGDNRTIGLKLILDNPNNDYLAPDPSVDGINRIDNLGRYRLDNLLPLKQDIISCLVINSPAGGVIKHVKAELLVLDASTGLQFDLGPMPSWTISQTNQTNSNVSNFQLGLIDGRNDHPEVELKSFCVVEMRDKGNEPSDRERDACTHI